MWRWLRSWARRVCIFSVGGLLSSFDKRVGQVVFSTLGFVFQCLVRLRKLRCSGSVSPFVFSHWDITH